MTPHQQVTVVLRDEKGSDVNLASHLLVDSAHRDFDTAAVVTNHSDLSQPIRLARQEFGRRVVIANPREAYAEDPRTCADAYLIIQEAMLGLCQFPDSLHDAAGTIVRPRSW